MGLTKNRKIDIKPKMPREPQQTLLIQNSTDNPDEVTITPVELNKNLLYGKYKFEATSKLKRYITTKTGIEQTIYTLREILTILKDIIREEGMYDHMNPSVILCSEELEDAIDMRALHVTEIRDRVMNQIEKIPREEIVLETRNQKKKESPIDDNRDNPDSICPTDTTDPKNHPDKPRTNRVFLRGNHPVTFQLHYIKEGQDIRFPQHKVGPSSPRPIGRSLQGQGFS